MAEEPYVVMVHGYLTEDGFWLGLEDLVQHLACSNWRRRHGVLAADAFEKGLQPALGAAETTPQSTYRSRDPPGQAALIDHDLMLKIRNLCVKARPFLREFPLAFASTLLSRLKIRFQAVPPAFGRF